MVHGVTELDTTEHTHRHSFYRWFIRIIHFNSILFLFGFTYLLKWCSLAAPPPASPSVHKHTPTFLLEPKQVGIHNKSEATAPLGCSWGVWKAGQEICGPTGRSDPSSGSKGPGLQGDPGPTSRPGPPSCRSGDGAEWGGTGVGWHSPAHRRALHIGETPAPARENEFHGAHGTSPGWQKVRISMAKCFHDFCKVKFRVTDCQVVKCPSCEDPVDKLLLYSRQKKFSSSKI